MRFFVLPLLTLSLFAVSDADAFFGCFARATGGMANINSGSCCGANGLWDSYCSGGAYTGYSYGSGFCAYAHQTPPARCGGGGCSSGASWFGGGGCATGGCASGGCATGGCGGGGCQLGSHLRGLFSRLSCRCRSAGSSWVGGGPLDSYTAVPTTGFSSGINYGFIDACSSGGCGAACGCSGGGGGGDVIMHSDGGYQGQVQGEIHSEGAIMAEPTPAPVEGAVEGPFETHGG